jgi:hypothetical protein
MADAERVYRIQVPNGEGQVRLIPEHAVLAATRELQKVRDFRSEQPRLKQAEANTKAGHP